MAVPPFDPTQFPRHDGYLRRVALSLVSDAAAADDLVQEAWIVALEHRGERISSFRSWMRTVLRMLALNRYRRSGIRKHEPLPEELAKIDRASQPNAHPEQEVSQVLREALDRLDDSHSAVLRMHYLDELPVAEVARRLDIPANTVKTRLRRGRTSLRDVLDRRYAGSTLMWSTALIAAFDLRRHEAPLAGGTLGTAGVVGLTAALVSTAALVLFALRPAADEPRNERTVEVLHMPASQAPLDAYGVEPELPATRTALADELARTPAAIDTETQTPQARAAAELAPATDERTILVQVVRPDGRPVRGAQLHAPNGPCGTTDANGSLRLAVENDMCLDLGETWTLWERGEVRLALYATADGNASSAWHYLPWAKDEPLSEASEAPETFVITLGGPDFVLRGQVLDEHGHPVAGASVTRPNVTLGPSGVELATVTDATGSFELAHLPQEASTVIVTKEGWAPTFATAQGTGRTNDHMVLTLTRGAELYGTVVDAAGTPVEGARVHIGSGPAPQHIPAVLTDADGHYSLRHCPMVVTKLWAQSPKGSAVTMIGTWGGNRFQADLTLLPQDVFRVRLVDEQGEPARVGAFTVRSFRDPTQAVDEGWSQTLRPDAEGRITFEQAFQGPIYGYVFGEDRRFPIASTSWTEPSDEERVLVCRDRRDEFGSLQGMLIDDLGRAVGAGAAQLMDTTTRAAFRTCLEENGRFSITRVPPGSYALRFLVDRGGRWGEIDIDVGPSQDLDLGTIRLPQRGQLRVDWQWPTNGDYALLLSEHVNSASDIWEDRAWVQVADLSPEADESHALLPGLYYLGVVHQGEVIQGRTFRVRPYREIEIVLGPGDTPITTTVDVRGMSAGGEGLIEVYRIDDVAFGDGELCASARERVRNVGLRGDEAIGVVSPDGVLRGEMLLEAGRWGVIVTTADGQTGYALTVDAHGVNVPAMDWALHAERR